MVNVNGVPASTKPSKATQSFTASPNRSVFPAPHRRSPYAFGAPIRFQKMACPLQPWPGSQRTRSAFHESDTPRFHPIRWRAEQHLWTLGPKEDFAANNPSDTNPCHEHIDSMPMRTGNPTPMLPKSGVDASTIRIGASA